MMSNILVDFKTDITHSVTETVESRINEWYEENDYADEGELVADNTTDVNALMQIVLVSNKSQASTSETVAIVQQPTAFETLLLELNPEKGSGPPICDKFGVLVNSLLKERLSKDLLGMKKEYLKPKICPILKTPKVNAMVWGHLKQYQKDLQSRSQML